MATIQNDRDVLLQAATTRVIPVPIPMSTSTVKLVWLSDYNLIGLGAGLQWRYSSNGYYSK